MQSLSRQRHPWRIIAVFLGTAVIIAAAFGLLLHFESPSVSNPFARTASLQTNTYLMHDGDTLDNIVTVPKGTYLVVKSDQGDHDANVQVTKRGGFVVETGGVLVLENVNLSGNGKDRSMPVFSVYGDMVMNDGAIGNFSSTSAGASSDYGNGGFPAVSVVDGTFTMNDGAIFGNSNTTTKEIAFGGALRAQGRNAAVIINDGRICGNRVLSSATVPYGSTVTANALGGAIAVTEGASITVNGGEISYNTAGSHAANAKGADNSICSGNGGAIAVYSSSRETISSLCLDGGRIVHNNAYRSGADKGAAAPANNETHGGGIFSSVYTRAALNAGKIARNTSDDKGGGAFLDCNKACGGASLKSTLVSGNEAESLGGGLWFCPNGEAKTFNEAKADGVAVFDNTTARRGTDGAGDDLYVSPRSGASGVTVTSTMLGGGSNAWYKDGGAATQKTSNYSSRYTSSGSGKTAVTLLQASAVVNKPSAKARSNARKSSNVEITGNRAKYGGGVGSNHYLKFGSVASDDKFNVTPEPSDPEKISINVKKTWIGDAGNAATVHLLADGEKVASATLNADNNWTYTFTGLDQEDSDGNEIAYTVAEDAVEGYSTEIAGDASEGFTVTNTNTETVDVSGAKVWDDDGDRDGLRPGSVTVNLLRDGTAVGSQTVASDGDSSWPFAFEDLAKYDSDGHEYSYTVAEETVPDGYTSAVTGSAADGFTITNAHTPETTSVSVSKAWDDSDDQDGVRPDSVTVQLYADGEASGDAVVLNSDNSWSYTWTNLDAYSGGQEITYTVAETDVPDGYTSTVTGSASDGFTVTNAHEPETTSVPVTKTWVGPEGSAATVHLYADGADTGKTLELSADDGWSGSFDGLAKYSSGNEIAYTVAEDAVEGYSTEIAGDASSGYTITNTNTETVDVSGTVAWNDDTDRDGLRPGSVTVNLLRDGTAVGSQTVASDGDSSWPFAFEGLAKYDSDGNEYAYTVEESDVPDGYTSAVTGSAADGFTITNAHAPETTSVSVTKAWDDSDDQDGVRPDSVTVQLYADGTAYGDAVVLSEDNSWTCTWSGLYAYSGGEAVAYTVAETDVPDGYTSAVSGSASSGFTITNAHAPETTSVSVDKEWVGPEGDSVTVHLYADGADTGKTLELSADDGWSGSFDGLAKYSSGNEIAYTVAEDAVEGYDTSITGDAESGYTITNTSNAEVGVRVVKDWRGMPEAVTVNLLADGVEIGAVTLDGEAEELTTDPDTGVEYGEDDAWVAVFTGLPKYDSQTGAEIAYSVTEDAVSETSSVVSEPTTEGDVTTFTITNTRSATFQPTVTKVWGEGVTSQEVTIRLMQGDEVVDEIALDGTADEDAAASDTASGEYAAWQGRFDAVDKYDDRGAPIDYTVSEATTGDWVSSVSGNARTGFTVQNAPLGATSATLAASKTVNGGEVGGSTFSFELYEGTSATGTPLQTVQNDHDGAVAFSPIVYTTSGTRTYTIVEVDEGAADVAYDGSVYTATVEVADADGDGTLDAPTVTYYDGDGNEVPAAAFDNTVITRTSVSFTKDWVGDAGESATVRLMCSTDGGDAEDTGLSVTVDGTADDLATDSATGAEYGEDAAWHGTFQNLVASDGDHTYSYALVEDAVDGYSSSSSGDASEGYVFTNTELTSVSGTKVWDDSDDQDGLRPDSVTVSLLQGSTVVDTQTVTADSDWSFSFGDLAKYDSDGNEYAYTVEEASVPDGYTSSVTENSDGTFTITNTHTPETTSVSVSKSWVGPAGTSATFALYADNVDTGQTLTLTADTGWSGSFDGLAKYNNGTEIAYTVSETGMGGVDSSNYSTTVSGDASSGYAFTNTNTETVTVHVQKNWVSLMDEESVTVRLIRNGVSTDTTITITADTDTASGDSYDGWSNDFTDLPKYDTNGDEIVYTVVEEGVYWSNNSTNYREYYGCTANYNTSGNTITCALWNEFGGGDG